MTLFSIDHKKNDVDTTIEKKLKNHRKQINVLSLQVAKITGRMSEIHLKQVPK